MKQDNIKLGVTLYSFTREFTNRKLGIEECLRKARDLGFEGIEIVAAQMVPEYPYPSEEWLRYFKKLLDEYELKPACWSAYIDMGVRSDRDLNEEEIEHYTLNDLICAKKAGFDLVRTQHAISPKIFRKMIKYCKDLDIKLAIEMHHPHHLRVPVWQEYLEIMREEGEGYLGVVPDFSIFQRSPHKHVIEQAQALGFRENILKEVIEKHGKGISLAEVLSMELTEAEREMTKEMYEMFNSPGELEDLKTMLPYTFYIHGKFYYLDKEGEDKCIPYNEIIPYLQEIGYKGYLTSEYEGHGYSDDKAEEQLIRFVKMVKKLLSD